ILSDRECLGSGLHDALGEAMAAAGGGVPVAQTFIDINGERYREEEWGMAMLRHAADFEDPLRYVAAARAWGDIGAASGTAFVCLATQAWARGYARGPRVALVAGSDAGERAVVVLGEPTARSSKAVTVEAPPQLDAVEPIDVATALRLYRSDAPVPPPDYGVPTDLTVSGPDHAPPVSPRTGETVRLDQPLQVREPARAPPEFTELIPPIWEDAANMPPKPIDEPLDPTKTVRHQGRKRKGRRPGSITLRVLDGPDAGKEQVITGKKVRVGRSEAADFTVAHPSLSGLHFELRVRRDGIELFDLASKNGTLLLGRVVYHARVQLGDVVIAGDCSIKLVDSAEIEVAQAVEARQDGLLGISETIQETFAAVDAAASCDLPTIIFGETGTGKEVAARAIHRRSKRRHKPFIVLDCSAIPADLAETVIFGHRKGAFTGAVEDRPGPFEKANQGTLFLDEIGELPLPLQAKLLRTLASGEVVRVGESEPRSVDVRIIAATHRDLPRMVDAETFRQDLYYRLAGFIIEVPTLHERGADEIEYLARELASGREGPQIEFGPEALAALRDYPWPGNVRELAAVVERAAVTCRGGVVAVEDLALDSGGPRLLRLAESARLLSYKDAHAELDRVLLPRILSECNGDLDTVAARLGRPRKALEKRLRDLRIWGGAT
ncbi:MAG: sigma 54-interacting transcriptional regulator, partial [Nannocystaceae bacterium]